ncbi:MAG: hypothetical protein PHO30_06975 [Candidatus Omnitrophica bacterium]|nr:hypothetical protein [Candidatus Omnitrophota bacterium]
MEQCELFECGFLQRFKHADRILSAGIISMYCRGPELEDCERRKYEKKYGKPPADSLRPDGRIFSY